MESDQKKSCCSWKAVSCLIGCIEIVLSIAFGFLFGASSAIFGDYQTAIVIFIICFSNILASIIWLRGTGLEEIRFLLTAVVWWVSSLVLWLLWLFLGVISGVELDKYIIFTTVVIVICHISTVLCYLILRTIIAKDDGDAETCVEDRRVNVPSETDLEECKELNLLNP